MRFWIVKGNPSRNDLDEMLRPGAVEPWVTRKPPKDWAAGDGIFFWKSAPALRLVGLGRIEAVFPPDADGNSWFDLRYLTDPFDTPLTIDELPVGDASFLKAGAAGTVFPLTDTQAERLLTLVRASNPRVRAFGKALPRPVPSGNAPTRALSIRQPWAELILRGEKTIEARSLRANIRERVHVYASLGDVHPDDQVRVGRQFGLDIDRLPRGVLVGTIEIVGCRPLTPRDSRAACFAVPRGTPDFAWLLSSPRRAKRLRKPVKHPQPVFFTPF